MISPGRCLPLPEESESTSQGEERPELTFGPGPATQLSTVLFSLFFTGGIAAMILGFKQKGLLLAAAAFGIVIASILTDLLMQALFFGLLKSAKWIGGWWSQ